MWRVGVNTGTHSNSPCKPELSVGPISSTQPDPQPNRTPYNQQQTFGTRKTILGTLFHRNIMTASKTPVNEQDNNASNILLSVEVYEVSLASVQYYFDKNNKQ